VDIAEFLLARIAEDEAVATAAATGPMTDANWTVREEEHEGISVLPPGIQDADGISDVTAHMERWNPARVFAECEAKRRIVTAYTSPVQVDLLPPGPSRAYQDGGTRGRFAGLAEAMTLLALPYADHPDYRPEWSA
jgi:hypothetical protein